jgi:hypothetical protein
MRNYLFFKCNLVIQIMKEIITKAMTINKTYTERILPLKNYRNICRPKTDLLLLLDGSLFQCSKYDKLDAVQYMHLRKDQGHILRLQKISR